MSCATTVKPGGSACALIAVLLSLSAGCDGGANSPSASGLNPGVPVTDRAENQFLSIVPPGSSGVPNGGIGGPLPGQPQLSYAPYYRDQLGMYENLAHAQTPLKSDTCDPPSSVAEHQRSSDQACNYFKNAGLILA